ncbi:transmembrane channel-like protein 5 [Leptopilina heterotoma]|uniref:transmembrane channel-like protein 5 n=1 Tax=Leptopilina heterotoma TaxID=63436 RepID=UPI001CA86233|nr:transmembrane channel-like protein 5 [Leptopilina heterotoma]XP_043466059.1 transmembrane channel-like protein 5 [Leptopilina heterotoma]XP_043466060.1 transmembrane channel-like protein 5 [Leptopilina heterotoma]
MNNTDRNVDEEIEMIETQGSGEPDNTRNVNSRNLFLQQRIFAHHARHLPSRRIVALANGRSEGLNEISSFIPQLTLRIRNLPLEDHATMIANHIEQNDDLMQNDPQSEHLRSEILRDMPQCLTVKRTVKAKLSFSASQKLKKKPVGYLKRLKYRISMSFTKFNVALREICSEMELWYHPIKSIEGQFGSGIATYFKFLRWLFLINIITCLLSVSFIIIPQSLIGTKLDNSFRYLDLLLGNGFLTNSLMYYGFYSNQSIKVMPANTYHIPSAYFLTLGFCYLFTFVLLCCKVAQSYRKCFIETSGGIYNQYAMKIFCGWDFGISSYKAAKLCSSSLHRELKELLSETESDIDLSCFTKFLTIAIQILMTIFVLAMIASTGGLLWILLNQHKADVNNVWSILMVPLIVTGIINIFPSLISWLAKMEKYSNDRITLYVTIIRMYTMTLVVIGTLLTYWITRGNFDCWQTQLAQEIYRLILLDFIISVIGVLLVQMIRSKCCTIAFGKNVCSPNFDIARNTMNLIYNQTLFWVAFYFSPMMSVIIVLKMMLTFYIKKFGLVTFCEPPTKPWRAAQTQTLFLALALLGMVGSLIALGFVTIYKTTGDCGPFNAHNFIWEVFAEEILLVKRNSVVWSICEQFVGVGSMSVVLVIMCISVYYVRAKAIATKEMVQILREMLIMQSRDKEFLLKGFTQFSKNGLRSSLRDQQRERSFREKNKENTSLRAGPSNAEY